MKKATIKSIAKINLGLFVTGKRNDGFHNIETVFYPVEIADEMIFTKSEKFELITDSDLLNKEPQKNLIYKAFKLLSDKTEANMPVKIELSKNIPAGAGLGGGSSNAASTLLTLNDMFNLGFSFKELSQFGLQLGSDVPFFIRPFTSYAEGRGEILTELDFELNKSILIVNPGIHVNTGWAYSVCDKTRAGSKLRELGKHLNDFDFWKQYVKNDFENAVFREFPIVAEVKQTLYNNGAFFSLMSGSGSTVYGIFETEEKARETALHFPQNYKIYIV